jgi:LuxR family maltose regulon positive regulatory protein
MSISTLVLNPKILIPRSNQKLLRRERLIDLLHCNIETKIQVVTAPAGYGKTTLLAEFIQDLNVPVCWNNIEQTDEDPRILLEGILSSIMLRFPGFGQLSTARINSSNDLVKDSAQVINTLCAEIGKRINDFFIIVLDDFHNIVESKTAKSLLNLLLERLPDNCHVIISSRGQVDLPVLTRNALTHPDTVITSALLSLTSSETKELINLQFGIELAPEDADKLTEHAGGWMLGVLSAVHYGLNQKNSKVNGLSQEEITDYLTSEVFEKQSGQIQEFLLASSTLEDLIPEYCNLLMTRTDSRKTLRQLGRQNLFLQCIDEEKRWYRYHKIFKDFLQEKLLEEDPDQFLEMHSLAGSIYEDNMQWELAIKHFSIAKKYEQIVGIINKVGQEFFKSGKWTTVSKWLEKLPEGRRTHDNDLMLLDAQVKAYLGKSDETVHILSTLINRLDDEKDRLIKGEALSWRGAAFRLNGYFNEARSDISESIKILETNVSAPELLGMAHRRLGDIDAEQGRFSEALMHFESALKCFTRILDVGEIARAHNSLGITYKRLGDIPKAKMHFEKARTGWLKVQNLGALSVVLNNVGIIYQRIGQYDLALETLRSGLEKARQTGYRRMEGFILVSIADVLRDLGQYKNALASYNEGQGIARQIMESSLVAYATAGIGETYRLQGDHEKASILLKESFYQAEEQQQPYESALFSIPIGVIEYEHNRFERSENILLDAIGRLEKIGDKDALARAYFHLAQCSFLSKKFERAIDWLKKASCVADELGYEEFFVIEGHDAVPLIQYGAEKEIGGHRFLKVLEKICHLKEKTVQIASAGGFSPDTMVEPKPDIEAKAMDSTSITVNGHEINDTEWRSQRAKEIFFYLLTFKNGRTREQISADLWPDLSPAKASSNFHINLFRARQALYPGIFIFENGCYKISPNLRISFDVADFENLIGGIDNPRQLSGCHAQIEKAIELYKGSFLKELDNEWIEVRRRELENNYIKALSALIGYYEKMREYNKATAFLEKLIAIDPYDEDVYYSIMRFHMAEKNSPMALYAYKRYAEIINSGAESGTADIRELQQRILATAPLVHQQN